MIAQIHGYAIAGATELAAHTEEAARFRANALAAVKAASAKPATGGQEV